MDIWRHCKELLMKMRKRPDIVILFFSFVFLGLRLWNIVYCLPDTREALPPKPIFNATDHVNDIYSGSLRHRDFLIQTAEVSFVFYYAPWCYDSLTAAKEFAKLAKEMFREVSFTAVNCWWDKGECRGSTEMFKFPQLFLHHRIQRKPIHYKGPHLYQYYQAFLRKVLQPITYIGNSKSVEPFLKQNQISVIAYLGFPFSKSMLRKYMQVALVALEKYPIYPVGFGLILSKSLSSELELTNCTLKLYDQTISTVYASKQLQVQSNTTPEYIVEWAASSQLALQRIFATGTKSNALHKVLKKNPTLLTFFTDANQLNGVKEVALKYNKLQHLHFHCCKSFENKTKLSMCLKSSNAINMSVTCELAYQMMESVQHSLHSELYQSNNTCFETSPLYNPSRCRLEICTNPLPESENLNKAIDSLRYRTNMTLNFASIDLNLNSGIAESIGPSRAKKSLPHHLILDVQNEHRYMMDLAWTRSNLENFVLNYTNHLLSPSRTNIEQSHCDDPDSDLHIAGISARDFDETILQSSKDSLVYYHTSWCGGCKSNSHVLLNLQLMMRDVENFRIYQVDEHTNQQLPYSFAALSYPTLVLFPANRTSDSVMFSKSVLFTLPNLIGFVLRHASVATKAQFLLSTCGQNNIAGMYPYEICRKNEILERLKSAFHTLQRLKLERGRLNTAFLIQRSRTNAYKGGFASTGKLKEIKKLELKMKTKQQSLGEIFRSLNHVLSEV